MAGIVGPGKREILEVREDELTCRQTCIAVRANKILSRRANERPKVFDITAVKPVQIIVKVIRGAAKPATIIVCIHQMTQAKLLEIVDALEALRAVFGLTKRGQKHRG